MLVKCKKCGKDYNIKKDFIRKADLKMKCRGCGEVIVVKKLVEDAQPPAAAAPASTASIPTPAAPSTSPGRISPVPGRPSRPSLKPLSADEAMLPAAKPDQAGMSEFDLDNAPVTVPPPKPKATIVGMAVPPPPGPVKAPATDDPFGELPAAKSRPSAEFELPRLPSVPPARESDLPVPKEKMDEPGFGLDLPEPGPPAAAKAPPSRPKATVPGMGLPPAPPGPRQDLPAPKAKAALDDLEMPLAPPKPVSEPSDLPTPQKHTGALGDFNLGGGGIDLVDDFGNLPVPSQKGKPASEDFGIDAPKAKPKATDAMFPPLDLEEPLAAGPSPARQDAMPPALSPSSSMLEAKKERDLGGLDDAAGPVELPQRKHGKAGAGALSDDIFGALDMPPAGAPPRPEDADLVDNGLDIERSQKFVGQTGGTSFGEIDLGEAPEPPGPPAGAEAAAGAVDLPERKRRPGDAAEALAEAAMVELDSAAAADVARRKDVTKEAAKAKAVPKGWKVVRGGKGLVWVLVLLIVAGAGVAAWQTGFYITIQKTFSKLFMGQDIDAYYASRDKAVAEVNASLKDDIYSDYEAGIAKLKTVYDGNRKDTYLAAHLCALISTMQLRFGPDKKMETLAENLLNQVPVENEFAVTYAMATAGQKLLKRVGALSAAKGLASLQSRNPNDRELAHLVALAFLAVGDGAQAEAAYVKLAALEGNSRRSQFGMIRAKAMKGEREDADKLLNDFIEKNPEFLEGRVLKARHNLILGSISQAESILAGIKEEKEIPAYLASSIRVMEGMILLAKEKYSKAKEVFEAVLKDHPSNVDALVGMGRIDLYEKNPAKALGRFNIVIGVDPLNEEAHFSAVQSLIMLDQFKEATERLERIKSSMGEDYRFYFLSAQLEEALDRDMDAESLFKKSIEKNPTNLDGYMALAEFYFKRNRNAEAMETLEQAQSKLPATAKLLTGFARGHIEREEYDQAYEVLKQAIDKDPTYIHAQYYMGVTLFSLKKNDEALKHFDNVAVENPSYPGLVLYQGLIFEGKGDMAKALESYNEAMKQNPDDVGILLRATSIYVANNKYDEAQPLVEKILKVEPGNAEAVYYQARIYFGREVYPEALHAFDRAIKLNPASGLYYLWAGLTSDKMANYTEALKFSDKALEKDKNLADALLLRGKLRAKMGAIKDAKADLKKAMELKPSLMDAWGPLGLVYEEERNFAEAVQAYKKYLEVHPEDYEVHCRLGVILFERGAMSDAREHFKDAAENAAEKMPHSKWRFTALFYLGLIMEKEGNHAKAMEYYQNYIDNAPSDAIDREEVFSRLEKLKQ